MSRPWPMLRRRAHTLLGLTLAAALGAAALPSAPAASAADAAAPVQNPCPDAFPVDQLQRGDAVHGLTVSEGTTPDEFRGEVVGVIPDGIALGLDMVMVKLNGSVITDADGVDRGIWAGMSGSPVYAEDGRLIGAVSYGLSASPSEYAGVTPAAAMYDLSRYEGASLARTRKVATTHRSVAQLNGFGLPQGKAQDGFIRLPMPTGVSGMPRLRLQQVTKRLGLRDTTFVAGGSGTADGAATEMIPGGNVAMAMSYGDVTTAAVGTVTAVCDGDQVLAFGHPFNLSGTANASLHGADALYIQRDDLFGSFKVATPTAPLGTFTQDRLAGILGRTGLAPTNVPVTSTVTSSEGGGLTGSTHVSDPATTAEVATMHLISNLDSVFNGYRGGTGRLTYSVTVRRQNGALATLRRRDVFSSDRDLTFSMPWEFYTQLSSLMNNRFENVDVVAVKQHARLRTAFRQHRLGEVQVRSAGHWVTASRRSLVPVHAGRVLRVRVRLNPARYSNVSRRMAHFRIHVPSSATGRVGTLLVSGGQSGFSQTPKASSFRGLLDAMAHTARSNSVTAQFRVPTRGGAVRVERHVRKPAPVVGVKYVGVAFR